MAAVNVGLKVEGARELRRTLKAAGDDLSDIKAAHAEAAKIAELASAPLTPVRTGALVASLRSSGTKTMAVVRVGGAKVPYAPPIHWGWAKRGIKPTLFLSHGAQSSEPAWRPVYEHAVDAALDKVKGI